MKNFSFIALAFITLLTISCEKKIGGGDSVDISANTRIIYKNSRSENLLTLSNGIKAADVRLYYIVGGKAELVMNGMLDAPTGVTQLKDQSGDDALNVVMNLTNEELPVTLIKLSDTDTDTIKTEYFRANGSIVATRIWYNGALKWDVKSNPGKSFVILK